jgi:hypothetical protein
MAIALATEYSASPKMADIASISSRLSWRPRYFSSSSPFSLGFARAFQALIARMDSTSDYHDPPGSSITLTWPATTRQPS